MSYKYIVSITLTCIGQLNTYNSTYYVSTAPNQSSHIYTKASRFNMNFKENIKNVSRLSTPKVHVLTRGSVEIFFS